MANTFGQSNEFSRVVHSTHAKFFRKEEQNVLRKRRLTALLQEKGRITYNEDGDELKWPTRYKRTGLTPIGDVVDLSFIRKLKDKNSVLPWVGYAVEDAQGKKERLMNRGKSAILKQSSLIMERLKDDMKDGFALELYKDASTAGQEDRISGLETALGKGAALTAGKGFTPSDTYAGHSTAIGVVGTWTPPTGGSWPEGDGDAHYEWNSPIIVDPTGSGWQASTKTWPNTCVEALRYGIFAAERTTESLDMAMLTRESYNQFADKLDSRERIVTERSGSNSLLVKLGFGSVTNFENVDVTWEQGVDAEDGYAHGYGLAIDMMELCCLESQLFNPAPIDYSIENLTWRYLVEFWGQMKLNPRNLVKWVSD
tara:strand:+ start:7438 stop:8544 length:1107 start_codon:yes stop_codon:yes gene_type:complete